MASDPISGYKAGNTTFPMGYYATDDEVKYLPLAKSGADYYLMVMASFAATVPVEEQSPLTSIQVEPKSPATAIPVEEQSPLTSINVGNLPADYPDAAVASLLDGTNTIGKVKITDGTEEMAVDASNNAQVSLGTKIAGEDLTNDVLKNDPASYTYEYISTNTTTTAKSGAGRLHAITIGETAAGAITIYDNTAASGTIIGILKASIAEGTYTFNVAFSTGLTIVTAAASKLTVSYR